MSLDLDAIEAKAKRLQVPTQQPPDFHDVMSFAREDLPPLVTELRFLRDVRDKQAAVIRKQALELSDLRYKLNPTPIPPNPDWCINCKAGPLSCRCGNFQDGHGKGKSEPEAGI